MSRTGDLWIEEQQKLIDAGIYIEEPGPNYDYEIESAIVCLLCEGSHGVNTDCQRNG